MDDLPYQAYCLEYGGGFQEGAFIAGRMIILMCQLVGGKNSVNKSFVYMLSWLSGKSLRKKSYHKFEK